MWDPIEFWRDVQKTETCWLWLGYVDKFGFPRTTSRHSGPARQAYLVAWEFETGEHPARKSLVQLCENKLCVRPEHVTQLGSLRHLQQTFWLRVEKTDGCWLWKGPTQTEALYGILSIQGKHHVAHRVAYELATGVSPGDLKVCHTCDNPPCVRPDHLFLGTDKDNADDKIKKGRQPRGEQSVHAKITEADVIKIRELRASGMRLADIAAQFGFMSLGAIQGIAIGRLWKHVPGPVCSPHPVGYNGPRDRVPAQFQQRVK